MPHTITSYTSIFAPWEEGQDEPERTDESSDTFPCDPDEIDQEEGLTAVDLAVKVLQYVTEASAYPWQPGAWYSDEAYVRPYSGETEEITYHLHGFSDEEQRAIVTRVLPAWPLADWLPALVSA